MIDGREQKIYNLGILWQLVLELKLEIEIHDQLFCRLKMVNYKQKTFIEDQLEL